MQGMGRTPITSVMRASAVTNSIKTTIPHAIADELNLEAGDNLMWNVEKSRSGKVATIKKIASG